MSAQQLGFRPIDAVTCRTAPDAGAPTDARPAPDDGPALHDGPRSLYLALLTWAFTLFSSVRVFSYLPTVWAIVAARDSSQHSILTWFTWVGANLTMAAWLYEHNGRRLNRAIAVNLVNALMCTATLGTIVAFRF